MGRISGWIAAAFLCAGLGAPASAAWVTYEAQGVPLFRFDAPEGWEVNNGFEVPRSAMPDEEVPAPRVIRIRPPGEERVMWTGLWVPWGVENFADARDYLRKLGPRLLYAPEVTYFDRRVINGRPARLFSGDGVREDRNFDFVFVVIQIAPNRVAIAAFVGEPGAFDRHESALSAMLRTIQPVGAAR